MRRRAALLALAVAAAVQTASAAVDFSFNGFATAGYAQSDTDEAVYGAVTTNEGIDDSGSWQYDSMMGLQGSVRFGEDWAVIARGLVRQQSDGDWKPSIDWAYVSWQPVSDVRVRAGLTRVPTFMFSDSVFLGFANTWIRPPHEVYGLSPIYLLEGIDVVWRKAVGPVLLTVQPYYGDSKLNMPNGEDDDVSLSVKDWYGLVLGAEWNSFTFRAGYGNKTLEEELPALVPLVAGINAFANSVNTLGVAMNRPAYVELAQEYRELADRVGMEGNKTPIFNVGAQYDNGREFVIGEYAQRGSDSIATAELTGMYLTVGRRFGSITPFVSAAALKVDSALTNDTIQASAFAALPASIRVPLQTNATLMDGYVDGLAAGVTDQDTLSAGVRYEIPAFSVLKGSVVKLQVDHINPKDGGRGYFQSAEAGFSDTVNMYSLTFDFVF